MESPHSLPDDSVWVSNQIDLLCDVFESSWKRREQPLIEECLRTSKIPHRGRLLIELVRLDVTYRQAAGELTTLEQYTSRFPEFYNVLEAHRRELFGVFTE